MTENLQDLLAGVRARSERLLRAFATLGGVILFGITLLVSASVFCRYALNQPILGDKELVEIGLSLVVMMAMPFAGLSGAHIRVDMLDPHIGPFGRYLGDAFARAASCVVLLLLVRKTWEKTLDAHEFGDVTNMIEIPVWIAYGSITVGMGLFALVLAGQFAGQLLQGPAGHE